MPALVAISLSANAAADPRWWTHDRPITSSPAPKSAPDVAVVVPVSVVTPTIHIVTWAQASALGDYDVYVAASFDGGCSFCGPVRWTADPAHETRPRIAAGVSPVGNIAFQVVFERDQAGVHVAGDASIPVGLPRDEQCQAFANLTLPTSTVLDATTTATRPRIAAAMITRGVDILHTHAVWQVEGAGVRTVWYDRDLSGDGSGWGGAKTDLTAALGETSASTPDVAADTNADLFDGSSATVVYTAAISGEVRSTRSTDSGTTWTASRLVSTFPSTTTPAVDSDSGGLGDLDVWLGVAWETQTALPTVGANAAHWGLDPVIPNIDFGPPDSEVGQGGLGPAVAVGGSSGTPFSQMLVFWDAIFDGEIQFRSGVLNAGNPPLPRDFDTVPFLPQRAAPLDEVVSVQQPFSNCLWDDDWPDLAAAACNVVARDPTTAARQVATDVRPRGGLGINHFASVFVDNRDGEEQIYLKTTDQTVGPAVLDGVSPSCSGPTLVADVTFDLIQVCPSTAEWIARYFIYYGSVESDLAGPAGPFAHRVEVPNVGLSSPTTVEIDGLNPGETYHFVVIAEDEARNIDPVDFDPRVPDNDLHPGQQASDVVMPDCAGCFIGGLDQVDGLMAVRRGPDIEFTWGDDPEAAYYHLNGVLAKLLLVEPDVHRPSLGAAEERCTEMAGSTSCIDAGAIADEQLRFYQLLSACGPDGVEEGPP